MRLITSFVVAIAMTIPAFAADPTPSGFLSTYEGFRKGPEGGVARVWTNPKYNFPKDLARYKAFSFDPIAVHLSKEGRKRGVNVTELAQLANKLRDQVTGQLLAGGYKIVGTPEPGVLRFVIALTDVEPSNAIMDTVTSIVPTARVFSFLKKQVTGKDSFVGSASIEGVVLDGATNETLIAFADKQTGDKGVFGATESMEDVNEAFKHWAKRLRLVLDQAHGKVRRK